MTEKKTKNSSLNKLSTETKPSESQTTISSSEIPKLSVSRDSHQHNYPVHQAEVPRGILNPKLWRDVVRYQFFYSLAGLTLGLTSIVGGIILFFRGVTGSTSWTAKVLGLKSNITDAAPGVVLFIVGLFMVFITRFVIKTKD